MTIVVTHSMWLNIALYGHALLYVATQGVSIATVCYTVTIAKGDAVTYIHLSQDKQLTHERPLLYENTIAHYMYKCCAVHDLGCERNARNYVYPCV